ncbi:unnamed protein product, partial [marine sediment metagenome]
MAVDDIIGIRIVGRYQQQNIVSVMHYKIMEQVSDEHNILETFADMWETEHKAGWLGLHVDTYSLIGLRAFSLTGDNKRPGIVHIDDAGTVALDESPSPLCRVITLYTDSDNYRRRGRIQLSGATVSDFNQLDGAVNTTLQGNLTTFGSALIQDLDEGGDVFKPGLAPTDVLPFEAFTSALGRATPSLIRSRRIRGML